MKQAVVFCLMLLIIFQTDCERSTRRQRRRMHQRSLRKSSAFHPRANQLQVQQTTAVPDARSPTANSEYSVEESIGSLLSNPGMESSYSVLPGKRMCEGENVFMSWTLHRKNRIKFWATFWYINTKFKITVKSIQGTYLYKIIGKCLISPLWNRNYYVIIFTT